MFDNWQFSSHNDLECNDIIRISSMHSTIPKRATQITCSLVTTPFLMCVSLSLPFCLSFVSSYVDPLFIPMIPIPPPPLCHVYQYQYYHKIMNKQQSDTLRVPVNLCRYPPPFRTQNPMIKCWGLLVLLRKESSVYLPWQCTVSWAKIF